MRNSDPPDSCQSPPVDAQASDSQTFFSSYYCATATGQIRDSITIGTVSEPESRFHYNACENAVIRCLAKLMPIANQSPRVWRFTQERRALQVLDIGSGTGHWVDFYLDVFLARAVTAVEFVPQMAEFLRAKYAESGRVTVLAADIVDEPLPEVAFDIVNAIGVMFHIVDDERWRRAVARLLAALKPGGLMLVGGDFGAETRDVQFHRVDRFETWREHDAANASAELVNKRVRSLADWSQLVVSLGATIVDVARSESCPLVRTPENDLLVLKRP